MNGNETNPLHIVFSFPLGTDVDNSNGDNPMIIVLLSSSSI